MRIRDYTYMVRRFLRAPGDYSNWFPMTHDGLARRHRYVERRIDKQIAWRRQVAAEQVLAEYDGPFLDEKQGFLLQSMAENEVFKSAVAEARSRYPIERIRRECSKPSKDDTLLPLRLNLNDPENSALRWLALDASVLAPATRYLRTLPILKTASVWFCSNTTRETLVGSQLFHFDHEDVRQVKAYVPLEDIDADCGPTWIIPAGETRKYIEHLRRAGRKIYLKERFTDDEVHQSVGAEAERPLLGRAGDLILVDTTNCLHYGSRPSARPKYLLMFQYLSLWTPNFFPGIAGFQHSETVESLVIPR